MYSYGYVNGNYVYSRDSSPASYSAYVTYNVGSGSGTYTVEFAFTAGSTVFEVYNVYNTGAYAIYRHDGGMNGETYDYRLDSGGSRYTSSDNIIWINDDSTPHTDNKFVIVHETGHAVLDHKVGGTVWQGNYGASNNCDEEPSSHSMRSREHDASAFLEGFAHFYAADVWNDDDETDCSFRYYKDVEGALRTVDCEFNNTRFEEYYHETQCVGGTGYGVELDWLRAFWDIHTNGSAPDPSFADILDWIDFGVHTGYLYGGTYGQNGAYDALDATSWITSGIQSTWNQTGVSDALDGI